MITLSNKMNPHQEVVDTELESGEGALLHLETHYYYSLNETGFFIWKLVKSGLNLEEISKKLEETFEVDEERAEQSVLNLMRELAEEKLVAVI